MPELIALMTGFADMNAKQQITTVTVDMAREQGRQQKLNNFANFLHTVGVDDSTLKDAIDDSNLDTLIESYGKLVSKL